MLIQQNLIQCQIHVIVAAADLQLPDEAGVGQCVQILGRGEPRYIQVTLQKFDLGVRVREQVVDQVLAVKLMLCPNAVLVVHQRCLDGLHRVDGLLRRGLDCLQDVPIWRGRQRPLFLQ